MYLQAENTGRARGTTPAEKARRRGNGLYPARECTPRVRVRGALSDGGSITARCLGNRGGFGSGAPTERPSYIFATKIERLVRYRTKNAGFRPSRSAARRFFQQANRDRSELSRDTPREKLIFETRARTLKYQPTFENISKLAGSLLHALNY